MALAFKGVPILGTHGPILPGEWDVQSIPTQFFGVQGESEITGETGGRDIEVEAWLHNAWNSSAAVVSAIETLNTAINQHGDLVQSGVISQTFSHCTFKGCTLQRGPLPSNTIGWFAVVTLRWRQLTSA